MIASRSASSLNGSNMRRCSVTRHSICGVAVILLLLLGPRPLGASSKSAKPSKLLALTTPHEARMQALEVQTESLVAAVGASGAEHCEFMVRQARHALAQDPYLAGALFNTVIGACRAAAKLPDVLLDTARTETLMGANREAQRHFLDASRLATAAHEIAPAMEGFVALAATLRRASYDGELPPIAAYVAALSHHGRLDGAAYETFYQLGRLLALEDDPRGASFLAAIPAEAPSARRALYVLGTVFLREGDADAARDAFRRAADLPPRFTSTPEEREREARVLELSWLAVGRLAFEVGDTGTGYFAYQQIVVSSPKFSDAYLEMGWLAIDNGDEDVAMLAFEPLSVLDANGEAGRRAALATGYVMLQRKEYGTAERHYDSVARRYTAVLRQFNHEVGRIKDFTDLARDGELRTWALENPLLASVMERREVAAARRLYARLDNLVKYGAAAKRQLETFEQLLAGKGRINPLADLARARADALETLRRVDALNLAAETTRIRNRWRAQLQPQASDPTCCTEPRQRLKKVRAKLEALMVHIDDRTRVIRSAMQTSRDRWSKTAAEHSKKLAELRPEIQRQQRELVNAAVAAVRHDLRSMAIEGDAGVLEAIWRYKEDHREQIRRLEIERTERIRRIEQQYYDALIELESPVRSGH